MLKWKNLTIKQQRAISNGCGSKGFIIPVPNFIFKASCDQHDFYYWRGGDNELRKKVDSDFLDAMLDDSKSYFHKFWAYAYYYGVRIGTILDKLNDREDKFWYYGKPRGRAKLNAYLNEKTVK